MERKYFTYSVKGFSNTYGRACPDFNANQGEIKETVTMNRQVESNYGLPIKSSVGVEVHEKCNFGGLTAGGIDGITVFGVDMRSIECKGDRESVYGGEVYIAPVPFGAIQNKDLKMELCKNLINELKAKTVLGVGIVDRCDAALARPKLKTKNQIATVGVDETGLAPDDIENLKSIFPDILKITVTGRFDDVADLKTRLEENLQDFDRCIDYMKEYLKLKDPMLSIREKAAAYKAELNLTKIGAPKSRAIIKE